MKRVIPNVARVVCGLPNDTLGSARFTVVIVRKSLARIDFADGLRFGPVNWPTTAAISFGSASAAAFPRFHAPVLPICGKGVIL